MMRLVLVFYVCIIAAGCAGGFDPKPVESVPFLESIRQIRQEMGTTRVMNIHLTLVPACPEVEVGMGTPRETVRLVGESSAPRMVGGKSGEDWTTRMNRYSAKRSRELAAEDLCGYVFKKNSPSCGMERVAVKGGKGNMPRKVGTGLFAAELMRRLPLLPVEEEGRLNDPGLRENFIVRVFAYHRAQKLFAGRYKRGEVVAFHSRQRVVTTG